MGTGPDVSVLYKLYLNYPRMINLHDLYIDFVGEVAPGRTPTDDDGEPLYRYAPRLHSPGMARCGARQTDSARLP